MGYFIFRLGTIHLFLLQCIFVNLQAKACDVRTAKFTAEIMDSHYMYSEINYPNNIEECHKIYHTDGTALAIKFLEFDVEFSESCNYDSLSISALYDLGSRHIGTYCGRRIFEYATFLSCNFSAVFKTDYGMSYKGFRLQFRQIPVDSSMRDACYSNPTLHNFGPDFETSDEDTSNSSSSSGISLPAIILIVGLVVVIIICVMWIQRRYSESRDRERVRELADRSVAMGGCQGRGDNSGSNVNTPYTQVYTDASPTAPPRQYADNAGDNRTASNTQYSPPSYEDLNENDRDNTGTNENAVAPPPSYETVVANKDAYNIS